MNKTKKNIMKYIIIVLTTCVLTSCSIFTSTPARSLHELRNDELCQMLGEKNHNGGLILNIYEELNKRTDKVDYERCFVLETTEKEKNKLEKFRVEPGMGTNHYPPDSIIKDAGMINSINQPGVNFKYSPDGVK